MVTFSGTPLAFSQYIANRTAVSSGVTNIVGAEADNDVVRLGISAFAQTILDDANAAAVLTTIGAQPLDADLTAIAAAGVGILSNYISGCTLSNNVSDATNDIDIAAGVCMDSTNAAFMSLSAITKRLDAAWAVGTNQGGLDTGAIADTTYHVYAIKRVDTGVVDAIFSVSASGPTLPTNYTLYRRVGSIVRSGAAILGFIQDGDTYTWKVQVADIAATDPGTAAVTRTLTVPVGIRVLAFGAVSLSATVTSANYSALLSDLSITDSTPSVTNNHTIIMATQSTAGTYRANASFRVYTNTAGQIRSRNNSTSATTVIAINTSGWVDTRGKG